MIPINLQIPSSSNVSQIEIISRQIIDLPLESPEIILSPILANNSYHNVFSALGLAALQNLPLGSALPQQLAVVYEFFPGDLDFLEFLIADFKANQTDQIQLRAPQLGPADPTEKSFQQLRGAMYYGDTEAADDAVTKMCRTASVFQIFEYIFELGIQDLSFGAKKSVTTWQYWRLLSILGSGHISLLLRSLARYFCQSLSNTPKTERHDNTCWLESESLANQHSDSWVRHQTSGQSNIRYLGQTIMEESALTALTEVNEALSQGCHPIWIWSIVFQLAKSQCELSGHQLLNDHILLGVASLFEIGQMVQKPPLRLKAMFQAVGLVADQKLSYDEKKTESDGNIIKFYHEIEQRAIEASRADRLRLYEVISGLTSWLKCQNLFLF